MRDGPRAVVEAPALAAPPSPSPSPSAALAQRAPEEAARAPRVEERARVAERVREERGGVAEQTRELGPVVAALPVALDAVLEVVGVVPRAWHGDTRAQAVRVRGALHLAVAAGVAR